MMNSRVAFPAECLQIIQRVVACVSGAASSGPAAIKMVDGEIVGGSAALTRKAVSFECLLSVAGKAVVVTRLSDIASHSFFWHACHGATYGFGSLRCNAYRAACFWAAVIDKVVCAIGASVDCSNNARPCLTAKIGQVLTVVLGTNTRAARGACLLAPTGGLIGSTALLADALAISWRFHGSRYRRGGELSNLAYELDTYDSSECDAGNDNASIPTSTWFNASAMSMIAEASSYATSGIPGLLFASDGTSNNRFQLVAGSVPATVVSSGGVNGVVNPETAPQPRNTVFKFGGSS